KAGAPCGPVYKMDEVFADPQVRHLAMTEPVEHPALGRLAIVRNAVRMTETPPTVRAPSPDLGDHTSDVLGELGYTPAEIARLRVDGMIWARAQHQAPATGKNPVGRHRLRPHGAQRAPTSCSSRCPARSPW